LANSYVLVTVVEDVWPPKAIAHKSCSRNHKTVKNEMIAYCIGAKHCRVLYAEATRMKFQSHNQGASTIEGIRN